MLDHLEFDDRDVTAMKRFDLVRLQAPTPGDAGLSQLLLIDSCDFAAALNWRRPSAGRSSTIGASSFAKSVGLTQGAGLLRF
jgi:hypothetical protein